MLKPLTDLITPEPEYGSDSPIVQCENCGQSGPTHRMINFSLIIGSPGHETLPPFQCPASQGPLALGHWGCSRDCWLKIAHACVEEHGHEMLKIAHKDIGLDQEIETNGTNVSSS